MKFTSEIDFFRQQPRNIRALLTTTLLYAIILPIIEIFVGAYIMRNTEGNSSYVALYQLFMYVGIVVTAILNGELMKVFKVNQLYSFGIIVSAIALVVMMFVQSINIAVLCLVGFALGASTGFFWTNRYLLTLMSTTDENRNYFIGLESFFFSLWNIVVPLLVGPFVVWIAGKEAFGRVLTENNGYQVVTMVALVVAVAACYALSKGEFHNPEQKRIWYFRFHRVWNKMLGLSALKGMVQGFLVTAPAILIMKLVGNEDSLGLIQGIAGAVTAIIVYVLGRVAKPQHRTAIFGVGLLVFFAGTLVNGLMFSAVGVIVFVVCKVFFQPLFDLAYFPTMMKAIDYVSQLEGRSEYTYIMTHEVGLFAGRAFGMLLFIVLAGTAGEEFALKYALIIVATLQLFALPLAKNIIKDIDNHPIEKQ